MNPDFNIIINRISSILFGKKQQIKIALVSIFAGGHLLIEDIPGIGKTTLAKVLSRTLGLTFNRIQCTSDMLPADITGVSVFNQQEHTFTFHPGPIFTQVLLADEINRTTPKTQSALLEAMEEKQVTSEGKTRKLEQPFFVIATQNPLEQSGTYPLPESQMDRFLFRISLGYPDRKAENILLKREFRAADAMDIDPILNSKKVLQIQKEVFHVHISDALYEYTQDIIDYSRNSGHFHTGLSPRAGISLLMAAKSHAYIENRDYCIPEDIQTILPHVTCHRLYTSDTYQPFTLNHLMKLFREVRIP